jgi:hypothetical protein
MRLTSYNIAVVALKAECCASAYVERMWGYIEEGDTEKEQCAYEKALQLSFLVDTLKRWMPIITSGYTRSATFTIDSGTYPIPFIGGQVIVEGVAVSKPSFAVLSGGSEEVFNGFKESVNCFLPTSDDIIHVKASMSDGDVVLDFTYDSTLQPLNSILAEGLDAPGVSVSADVTDEVAFAGAVPNCLTDEEILSVVEKIQKLCTCGC